MEMQPPVSPQQSECNPVGALQVCAFVGRVCLSSQTECLWVGWEPRAQALFVPSRLPFIESWNLLGANRVTMSIFSLSLVFLVSPFQGAGGTEGLAVARVHSDPGVWTCPPKRVHHDLSSGAFH